MNPIEFLLKVTEEQGNSSPLGHTSSLLSKRHFDGDLNKDKRAESNILTEGPEWFTKSLLVLNKGNRKGRHLKNL